MHRSTATALLAAMTCAVVTCAACGPSPTVIIDGEEQPVTDVQAVLTSAAEGGLDLSITVNTDPIPEAIDDERSITVNFRVADESAVALGEPLALGGAVDVDSFRYGCFCGEGDAEPGSVTGTIQFDALSADDASGELEITLTGGDTEGRDFGTVEVTAPFSTD